MQVRVDGGDEDGIVLRESARAIEQREGLIHLATLRVHAGQRAQDGRRPLRRALVERRSCLEGLRILACRDQRADEEVARMRVIMIDFERLPVLRERLFVRPLRSLAWPSRSCDSGSPGRSSIAR